MQASIEDTVARVARESDRDLTVVRTLHNRCGESIVIRDDSGPMLLKCVDTALSDEAARRGGSLLNESSVLRALDGTVGH